MPATINAVFYPTYKNAERDKLALIEDGATANSSDAFLLARANHTGTQLLSTLSDLTGVGGNIARLTNPSAISFLKVAADNSVSARTPAQVLSDIGAETSGAAATAQAYSIQRANHTGSQLLSTISDANTLPLLAGANTFTVLQKIQLVSEQLRLGYDGSNYNSFTVGSTGALTIAATGTNPSITLTPGGTGKLLTGAIVNFTNATVATSASAGAVVITGGLAIGGGIVLSGNITTAGLFGSTGTGFKSDNAGYFYWNTRSTLKSPSDGVITLGNNAETAFGSLLFGPSGTTYNRLKHGGTGILQGRLADDSAFCYLQGKLTTDTNATTGLLAGALSATTNATIVIYDAGGTAYRVPVIV